MKTYRLVFGLVLLSLTSFAQAQLANALDGAGLVWTTGGNASWIAQSTVTHDGSDAALTGGITHGQTSWLQTTVTGPGTLTFWWKVSSEMNYDYLTFSSGPSDQFSISGEIDWQFRTVSFPAGTHVLRWSYSKDVSVNAGQDRGWLDEVTFTSASGPAHIVSQPSDLVVPEGNTASFTVGASGTSPLSYQWFFAPNTALGGGTGPTLTINNVQAANAGGYFVIVTNNLGAVTSRVAVLSVAPGLAQALDATNLTWSTGGGAAWNSMTTVNHDGVDGAISGLISDNQESWVQTTVTGPGVVSFWWKVSSEMDFDILEFRIDAAVRARISGEENWQQVLASIPAGTHVLRWRYSKDDGTTLGQDRGWVDQVTYLPNTGAPQIVAEPADQRIGAGDTLVESVGVAGQGPLQYQWFVEGNPIAGATNATLQLAGIDVAQAGGYHVAISNSLGTATSRTATVQVITNGAVQTILLFAENTYTTPYKTALQNLGQTFQSFNDHTSFNTAVAAADVSRTLVIVHAPLGNHNFNAVAAFVRAGGRAVVEYWGMGLNSTFAEAFQAQVTQVMSLAQPVYDWGGSSFFGGVASPLSVTDLNIVDGQKLQPLGGSQAVGGYTTTRSGNEAALVLGHSGRTLLNGFSIDTVNPLATAVRFAENELRHMLYSHLQGAPEILAQPASQSVVIGLPVLFSVGAGGSAPLSYQWRKDGENLPGATSINYNIANVQQSHAGGYSVVVSNAFGAVTSSVAVLTVTSIPPISNALLFADSGYPSPCQAALDNLGLPYQTYSYQSAINAAIASANPATTLVVIDAVMEYFHSPELVAFVNAGGRAWLQYWYLGGNSTIASAFQVNVPSTLGTALPIYNWGGSTFFAGVPNPVVIGDWFVNDGVRLQAIGGAQAVAGYTSTASSTEGAVVIGNSGRTIVLGMIPDSPSLNPDVVRFIQNQLETFNQTPPSITVEPEDKAVVLGRSATFSVTAAGAPPLRYQWFFNETNLLSRATNATFTLSSVQETNVGSYLVVVSNLFGAVTSRVANLQLVTMPVITGPPSQTAAVGESVTLVATVTGSQPMAFRWNKNSSVYVPLGQGEPTLVLSNLVLTNAGSYRLIVSNAAISSSGGPSGYLTVVQPQTNLWVAEGASATFAVQVSGPTAGPAGAMRYRWEFNGEVIGRGTNAVGSPRIHTNTFTLTNLQAGQSGTYAYVLTDTVGTNSVFPFTVVVASPVLVPAGENVGGKTQPEWTAEWWKWALTNALEVNALPDETGARAHLHQQDPVWFLAGVINASGTVVRNIRIPEGKYLFLPIINAECSTVEAPPWYGTDEADMRACARSWIDTATNLYLEVDGTVITNLAGQRMESPLIAFNLPTNNILYVPGPTNGLAVSDGYWAMLNPLPQGTHTIRFRGTLPTLPFNLDVTYHLTVADDVILTCSRVGQQFIVSWGQSGWVLQESTNVADPSSWRDVSGPQDGQVEIAIDGANRFFRLRKQ